MPEFSFTSIMDFFSRLDASRFGLLGLIGLIGASQLRDYLLRSIGFVMQVIIRTPESIRTIFGWSTPTKRHLQWLGLTPEADYDGPIVVLVHGIWGDVRTTWGSEAPPVTSQVSGEPQETWPAFPRFLLEALLAENAPSSSNGEHGDLDKPGRIPHFLLMGYESGFFVGGMDQGLVASEFARLLLSKHLPENARLFFVTHSQGGLVTGRAIVGHPKLANRVRCIISLGTPWLGSERANWAMKLSPNPQLRAMAVSDTLDPVFRGLVEALRNRPGIRRACAAETNPIDPLGFIPMLGRTQVVAEDSALALCDDVGSRHPAQTKNHLSICKPSDQSDSVIDFVKGVLREEFSYERDEETERPQRLLVYSAAIYLGENGDPKWSGGLNAAQFADIRSKALGDTLANTDPLLHLGWSLMSFDTQILITVRETSGTDRILPLARVAAELLRQHTGVARGIGLAYGPVMSRSEQNLLTVHGPSIKEACELARLGSRGCILMRDELAVQFRLAVEKTGEEDYVTLLAGKHRLDSRPGQHDLAWTWFVTEALSPSSPRRFTKPNRDKVTPPLMRRVEAWPLRKMARLVINRSLRAQPKELDIEFVGREMLFLDPEWNRLYGTTIYVFRTPEAQGLVESLHTTMTRGPSSDAGAHYEWFGGDRNDWWPDPPEPDRRGAWVPRRKDPLLLTRFREALGEVNPIATDEPTIPGNEKKFVNWDDQSALVGTSHGELQMDRKSDNRQTSKGYVAPNDARILIVVQEMKGSLKNQGDLVALNFLEYSSVAEFQFRATLRCGANEAHQPVKVERAWLLSGGGFEEKTVQPKGTGNDGWLDSWHLNWVRVNPESSRFVATWLTRT